ncbi:MAG: N-acetylmuramoyl-L-alanine amidase [Anaerolineae bacterium]|nr:N-acetylmuramoyl-L-alanine amidase [Anaerolineae bacterium]
MSTIPVTVNVDQQAYQKARQRAQSEGKSLDQVVSQMLSDWTRSWSAVVVTPPPSAAARQYTVRRGDTLAQIAVRFYGDAKRYVDIARANNITNPAAIRVGQVLYIPDVSGQPVSSTPVTVPTTTIPATGQRYTIKRGDTLAQIAVRFYGDAKRYVDIARVNNITDPRTIRVGQVLLIPAANQLSAPPPPATTTIQPITDLTNISTTVAPSELAIEFIQSQHYNQRPAGAKIWAIVVHATANSTLEGVIRWFTNPQAFVSAHYNIGKDGRIVQMVQDELRGWHAGKSIWKGVPDTNDYSIGIELVNKNDGIDPYPPAQYRVLVALCKTLVAKYGIKVGDIMGHKDISLVGKTDPAGFDMEQLRRDVAS